MSRGLRLDRLPKEWEGRVAGEKLTLPKVSTSPGGMNKLEAKWAQQLEIERQAGEIRRWRFNEIKLKLADGSWFKCDFWVVCADGSVRMDETKGHWREAAKVRIRVAARLYPEFRFHAIQWKGREGWKVEEFGQ